MKTWLSIQSEPIDEAAMALSRAGETSCGAIIYFLGTVRAREGEAPIRAIEYEAFAAMAEHQFQLLFAEIKMKWPVESIRLIHRIGPVEVGVASLWVEVIAPHRAEAFAASQYLIDQMKKVVPIWKKPISI